MNNKIDNNIGSSTGITHVSPIVHNLRVAHAIYCVPSAELKLFQI